MEESTFFDFLNLLKFRKIKRNCLRTGIIRHIIPPANKMSSSNAPRKDPHECFVKWVNRCLSHCATSTQRTSMEDLVETLFEDGSMTIDKNWDVEPLLPLFQKQTDSQNHEDSFMAYADHVAEKLSIMKPSLKASCISKGKPLKPSTSNKCANCGKQKDVNFTCGRCKSVKYCNAECQKAHWTAGHKQACASTDTPTASTACKASSKRKKGKPPAKKSRKKKRSK